MKPTANEIKAWAIDPLLSTIREVQGFIEYTNLVAASISVLAHDPAVEILLEHVFKGPSDREKLINLGPFAKVEKEQQYYHLTSQFVIALYSYLESGVKDLIIAMFKYHPTCSDISELVKIKNNDRYAQTNDDEKAYFLYHKYETVLKVKSVCSIERFEKLLAPIGLSGEVEKNVGDAIFELAQLRNLLAHSGAKADAKLIALCPHLELKLNEKVSISIENTNRYAIATISYFQTLVQRIIILLPSVIQLVEIN